MSDRLVKIPKRRHGLYDEAVKIQKKLLADGYKRPIFDIMTDLIKGKKPKKPENRGWSI